MKGRAITASENKQYALQEFFDNNNRLKCPECSCLLDPFYRSLHIDFKSKFDFSATYEGVFIASRRFKEFIQLSEFENLIFFPVNGKNDFFYFHVVNNVIQLDEKKSGIKYDKKCKICNYPRNIYGGAEIFIKQNEQLSDGFFTSDVYWRTHNIFRPKILIGLETYEKLKGQKFLGLDMGRKIF